jgi:hypothetical protein
MGLLRGEQAARFACLEECSLAVAAYASKVEGGSALLEAELASLRTICTISVDPSVTSIALFSETQASVNATIKSLLVHRRPFVQRSLEIEAMGGMEPALGAEEGGARAPPIGQPASAAFAAFSSSGSLLTLSALLSLNGLFRMV